MSQQQHYYAAPQPGGFPYAGTAQGIPGQAAYQQPLIMVPNVQPGQPGPQQSFAALQSTYPGLGGSYGQGPPRGIGDQALPGMQYGQGVMLGAPFQPTAGPGSRPGYPPILISTSPQSYLSQPVMQPYGGSGQWTNNTQYANGLQQTQLSNSYTQPSPGIFKKPPEQRPQIYSYGNPQVGQSMSQQSALSQPVAMQQPVEKRKLRSSAIKIVDPSTGLEVNTEDLTKSYAASHMPSGSAADAASPAYPAVATNNVAADFAAKVAAALTTSSESTAAETSTSEAIGDSSLHDASVASAAENISSTVPPSSQAGDICQQGPSAADTSSINDSRADSDVVTPNVSLAAVEVAADSAPPTIPQASATDSVGAITESDRPSDLTAAADADSSKTVEPASLITDPASKSDALLVEPGIVLLAESAAPADVNLTTDGPVLPSGGNAETANLPSSAEDSPAVSEGPETDVGAGRASAGLKKEDQTGGKDAKKRKKRKDVNNKGQALQKGTDMDAFIDEVAAKQGEETDRTIKETNGTSSLIQTDVPAADVTEAPAETVVQNTLESEVSENLISQSETSLSEVPVGESMTEAKAANEFETVVSQASVTEPTHEAKVVDEPTATSQVSDAPAAEISSVEVLDDVAEMPANSVETSGGATVEDSQTDPTQEVEDKTAYGGAGAEESSASTVEAPKLELKYKYSEDQWSPLNPEGKKQYDREFMMQLQFADFSLQKPANLPPLSDIILNEPTGQRNELGRTRSTELGRTSINIQPDFTPGYVKSSPSGSRRPVQRNSMKKDMGMGPSRPSDRKVINVTLQQDVQLSRADNAWKPLNITKKEIASDESLATLDLYKKVRGILNKLTPQKFNTLMQQVLDLQIDTEGRLKGCIDIIFEKAISEPNFSVAYANMAKRMLSLAVPKAQDPSQTVTFRTLLLNKCQQEFEKDKLEEMDLAERQKKIDEADSDEKKKQLIEEQEEAATKSKRRSLGNIRFIGELYKLRMLTEAIMHECLMKLLRTSDEDSLECLCQLLTTVGQELDNKQSKLQPRMELYFKQLDALVTDRSKVSSRIRFMILDTIDLRKSNWVPRRANNNPKTIEQIHKEAQEEEQKKQAEMQKAAMDRTRRGGPSGPPAGGRGGPPQAGSGGEDGWNTVTRPPKNVLVDPTRLKLTKREQVDDNIQLGPGGRGMTTWQFGSRGGGKVGAAAATPDNEKQQMNRYSLLNSQGFEPPMDPRNRPGGRGAAAPGGAGFRPNRDYHGSISGPAGRPVNPRPSLERNVDRQDRRDLISPASSRSASREPRPVEAVQQVEPPAPAAGAASVVPTQTAERELSPEEMEKKTKSLMEEYLHLNDLKEATECVQELGSSKSLHLFVYHSLLLNLERSPQARQRTGTLLHHLIKNRVLSSSQYVEGLRSVLESAEEMVLDIPRIWQYLGELISPMIEEGGCLPLASLRSACQPLLDCSGGDKAGVVMSLVLHDAVRRLGESQIAQMWQQSGLEWSEFLPADKVNSFLEENGLEFTLSKTDPNLPKQISIERLQEDLTRIYENSDSPDKEVEDYMKNKVEQVDGKSVRALTTVICSTALQEVPSKESSDKKVLFDLPLIKKRLPLLNKIINGHSELEIEVLFAVQVIVHKKDVYTGAISDIFDALYDEDVVSDSTFFRWRDERMFGEQMGRGVAINTLNQFFKWLEEDTSAS